MKVLLIAEACNPQWTSVPLVGWSHCAALRRVVDAHLVTQIRNREAILAAGLVEGRDFTAIDSEAITRPIRRMGEMLSGGKGKGWTALTAAAAIYYYYFERLLWKQFGKRIAGKEFAVVHRVTPLSPTVPSLLAAKCRRAGVPFMLGPLNGGVPWPRQFDALRRREREWLSYLRSAYRVLPGYRSTLKNASAIVAGSTYTLSQIPEKYRHKCFYMPENAIDPERFPAGRARVARLPLKVVFLGRLVPYKGADMLVEAAAPLVKRGLVNVDILGDGPEMGSLRGLVERLDLGAGVRLLGWVKHEEVQKHLKEADIFGFPSIREFGGGVVLEAMACGLVPLVVDYAGPAELVTEGCGVRVGLGSRAEIVARVGGALEGLAAEPGRIHALSAGAVRRAGHLTWDAKAQETVKIYHWLAAGGERPEFPMPVPEAEPAVAAEPAVEGRG
jgi:glycosyltransferase involved in cell wall biosynthesis